VAHQQLIADRKRDHGCHIENSPPWGALVMTIPPALLKLLHVDAGDQMTLDVADGQLIARPLASAHRRYSLAEILEGSESIAELNADTAWARDGGSVGRVLG